MGFYFSLQMISVMFFHDMAKKKWYPLGTRNRLKKEIKEKNLGLWKMITSKNIWHWTFVGFIAFFATPFWRPAQLIVRKVRP
jgi:hypothetical protein